MGGESFRSALDINRDGMVQFCELLGLVVLVSQDVDDAANFFFRLYDADKSGCINSAEFRKLVQGSLRIMNETMQVTVVKWLVSSPEDQARIVQTFHTSEDKLI